MVEVRWWILLMRLGIIVIFRLGIFEVERVVCWGICKIVGVG